MLRRIRRGFSGAGLLFQLPQLLLLLATDTMAGPGHGLQTLLLHFAAASYADAVPATADTLQGLLNKVQNKAVIVALLQQEFLCIGAGSLVGYILRGIFVSFTAILFRLGNSIEQLRSSFEQPVSISLNSLLVHSESPGAVAE